MYDIVLQESFGVSATASVWRARQASSRPLNAASDSAKICAARRQSLPGIPRLASLVVNNSQVTGLGRPLAGSVANITVANIIRPMTEFEDRLTQLDLRFIRNFRMRGARLQATFDVYNVFNAATVLSENYQYGATWRSPTSLLDARVFKVGVQVDF